jgi:hypothetical protein
MKEANKKIMKRIKNELKKNIKKIKKELKKNIIICQMKNIINF